MLEEDRGLSWFSRRELKHTDATVQLQVNHLCMIVKVAPRLPINLGVLMGVLPGQKERGGHFVVVVLANVSLARVLRYNPILFKLRAFSDRTWVDHNPRLCVARVHKRATNPRKRLNANGQVSRKLYESPSFRKSRPTRRYGRENFGRSAR
jgi:hypothetical protein